MSTLDERVNNAIVQLDWLTPAQPVGVRQAVTDLATAWLVYWDSAERKLSPPMFTHAKVARFADWYARAFVLQSPALQARLTHPRTLDATSWAALEDQLAQTTNGLQAQGEFAAEQLSTLKAGLAGLHSTVLTTVLVLGGVAIGVGLVYVLVKRA